MIPVRVSVPIEEADKEAVRQHPEEFGLRPGLSLSQMLAQLLKEGMAAARRRAIEERRQQAYAAWADDEEMLATVQATQAAAVRSGLL